MDGLNIYRRKARHCVVKTVALKNSAFWLQRCVKRQHLLISISLFRLFLFGSPVVLVKCRCVELMSHNFNETHIGWIWTFPQSVVSLCQFSLYCSFAFLFLQALIFCLSPSLLNTTNHSTKCTFFSFVLWQGDERPGPLSLLGSHETETIWMRLETQLGKED